MLGRQKGFINKLPLFYCQKLLGKKDTFLKRKMKMIYTFCDSVEVVKTGLYNKTGAATVENSMEAP